jgi:hypothetical protein
MNVRASNPAPTSDHAFYLEGFKALSSPDLMGMLWLGLSKPYADRYPAFESFARRTNQTLSVEALGKVEAAGVKQRAVLDFGSPAYGLYEAVMGKEVDRLLAIYDYTYRNSTLAHHVPAHVRVMAAAFRYQGRSASAAVTFLRENKSNRDTAKSMDRHHVNRAREAYAEAVAIWEQSRSCEAVKAAGFDIVTLHEMLDDGIMKALVEIRQRAATRKAEFNGALGAELFTAIVKREEVRGKHPADGVLKVAQRLDEEAGTPFRTIGALSLMTCCIPKTAADHPGMGERIPA